MKTLDTTPRTFNPDTVQATVDELQANDPYWTYTAKFDPKGTGNALIIIHDEDGEFVSYMT